MSAPPALKDYKRSRIKVFRQNDNTVMALLGELRRAIFVPDEVDDRFRRWLRRTTENWADAYKLCLLTTFAATVDVVNRYYVNWGQAYLVAIAKNGVVGRIPEVSVGNFAEQMLERGLPSGMSLSERIWDLSRYSRDIETIIWNGIANKIDTPLIAKQLDGFLLPNRHLIAPTPNGRSLGYDAMRLARTEVANAFRLAEIYEAKRTPWITGLRWEMSSGHTDLCECDGYDGQVFLPDEVPDIPHPHCMCILTPEVLDSTEWDNAIAAYLAGESDDYGIGDWISGWALE